MATLKMFCSLFFLTKKMQNVMLLPLSLYLCLFGTHIVLVYGCGQSEYQSEAGECCPMCSIGQIVLRDCKGDFSTTCKPCSRGTYMNEPNGLHICFTCKTCDSEQGLRVSLECNTIRNTQCEVLDGYYCKSYTDKECSFALRHRTCDPGQEIKSPGTKDSDTLCDACPTGSFSSLGINCTKWTDCSVKGEVKDKEGSSTEDVRCKQITRLRYIFAIPIAIFLLAVLFLLALSYVREKKKQTNNGGPQDSLSDPIQESIAHHSQTETSLHNMPEENREDVPL